MKILVCLKQVPHQDSRLDITGDGAWIKEDGIKFEINSYDAFALEEALRLKDAGTATEVIVASIGPKERVSQALRTALGMGADRAGHVKDSAVDGSDALGIARTLAEVAKSVGCDAVFLGLMSAPLIAPVIAYSKPIQTYTMKYEFTNGMRKGTAANEPVNTTVYFTILGFDGTPTEVTGQCGPELDFSIMIP